MSRDSKWTQRVDRRPIGEISILSNLLVSVFWFLFPIDYLPRFNWLSVKWISDVYVDTFWKIKECMSVRILKHLEGYLSTI